MKTAPDHIPLSSIDSHIRRSQTPTSLRWDSFPSPPADHPFIQGTISRDWELSPPQLKRNSPTALPPSPRPSRHLRPPPPPPPDQPGLNPKGKPVARPRRASVQIAIPLEPCNTIESTNIMTLSNSDTWDHGRPLVTPYVSNLSPPNEHATPTQRSSLDVESAIRRRRPATNIPLQHGAGKSTCIQS